MEKQAHIEKFKEFLRGISPNEKVAVVHHRDTDGFCSALVFSKALEKLRGKRPDLVFSADYHEKALMKEKLTAFGPGKIVFLDLSIDQFSELIKELEKIASILVLDHHKIYNDLNSERTVFIKAQMLSEMDGSNYPASKLAFDLCSELTDMDSEAWIACVGLLGDMSHDSWEAFFRETSQGTGLSLEQFRALKDLVSAVEVLVPEKFPELFDEFYSKGAKELLENKFRGFVAELNVLIGKYEVEFREKAEFFPELELYFFAIHTDLEIKSAVIDRLTLKHPDKTIIVFRDRGGELILFSARRQDFKVKMNELLEKATAGIKGASGGGHIPAAAGSVPRESLEEFRENVKRIIREKLGKR